MATSTAHAYRPYRSLPSATTDATTWISIDLGTSAPIDAIRLLPSSAYMMEDPGAGFPLRFRIEIADDDREGIWTTIADWTTRDFPDPGTEIVEFDAGATIGRHVAVTVTRLRPAAVPTFMSGFPDAVQAWAAGMVRTKHTLCLTKISVLSRGADIAVGAAVSVDPALGNPVDAAQLTRPPRPQGEHTVTDHPGNVTSPDAWSPVPPRATVPTAGVVPRGDLFGRALRNNADYLRESFDVNDLTYRFLERAGLPFTPPARETSAFWEDELTGSNAGRFLMGAATTLRWIDDPELARRLDEVVDLIERAQDDDGYLMAYPREAFLGSERGAYTRSWVTQGLLEAGLSGRDRVWGMLRGYYDYFNAMPELPIALRECGFGPQGTVATMRVALSRIGRVEDVQVVQRYFQENYLLDALARREPDILAAYPYDRTHSYLLTCIEPYADLYRATGDRRYLEAVLGAWELYRTHWQAPGGSISMIEFRDDLENDNPLHEPRGETCGSVFWVLLNQRLHLLDPEDERYVAEIERSLYNVVLANQDGSDGIRYHTMLVGKKEPGTRFNTCCEGQGTRLLGSLPEFIYSVAPDGIYVNLYEASSITCAMNGTDVTLTMRTAFPDDTEVVIDVAAAAPVVGTIRIRVPSWASAPVQLEVDGRVAATGSPGSYVALERRWQDGDRIAFTLPVAVTMERYTGVDQVGRRQRYVLHYGPLLLALLQKTESEVVVGNSVSPDELLDRLQRVEGEPLRFRLFPPLGGHEWIPYHRVQDEYFTTAPFVRSTRNWF